MRPFRIEIAEADLDELRDRLRQFLPAVAMSAGRPRRGRLAGERIFRGGNAPGMEGVRWPLR